jgi:hypothetical protein
MQDVQEVADQSGRIGTQLGTTLTRPEIRQAALVRALDGYAQQQDQLVGQAQRLGPPGPLRRQQEQLVEALQFRVSGLRGLADAFGTRTGNANQVGERLATQSRRLIASDIVWDDLFDATAKQTLADEGVHGVSVPRSHVVTNPDLISAATFTELVKRIRGASTGGTASGLHGTGLVSVTAQPQGLVLSPSTDNKVIATTSLAFDVAVKDTGENLETKIPVTLTIQKQGTPIKQTQTIQVISPGETKTVTFRRIDVTGVFGSRVNLKIDVQPVKKEARVDNNSAQYPVIFSLAP